MVLKKITIFEQKISSAFKKQVITFLKLVRSCTKHARSFMKLAIATTQNHNPQLKTSKPYLQTHHHKPNKKGKITPCRYHSIHTKFPKTIPQNSI